MSNSSSKTIDVQRLRAQYDEQVGENWKLRAEIERLRAQVAEMKRCTFGGDYGRCKLEAGHEGRHDLA